ncbi:MAG: mechanosensitive ion channel [Treponema sp.]|nr:mechanosensitive ion channel [Treponema sp.]
MLENLYGIWNSNSASILGLAKNVVASVLIIIIGAVLSRVFRRIIEKASSQKLNVNESVGAILRHIVRYGIFIICVIMILNVFGVNTSSLLAVLGAAGLAVGLAMKDTLGNIAAGIIILLLGSYRCGEFIEFGSYSGTVRDISLFTTVLETPDGIYISAPNSAIWGSPLKNFTRNGRRRMELSVRISYSDSLETAFQVMRDIITSETRFLQEPAPQVILQAMQDSYVTITIRAWASVQLYWDIYWHQMRNMKEKIEEAGLHIPFPQMDMHVRAISQL